MSAAGAWHSAVYSENATRWDGAVEYKKFKEQKPEDTVYRIQSILHEIGLTTVCEWEENEYEGCYSNRVSIYPTALGTNGKGTDRMYAMASGYAELMERIQNSLLFTGALSPEDVDCGGFQFYPDQKLLSFEELIDQGDFFTEHFFRMLGCETDEQKKKVLKSLEECGSDPEGQTFCFPFADIDRERIVYLSAKLVKCTCGSTGMAAGNTREEALVQGFSEIFERYVNRKIMAERICPPSVPREVLAQVPSLYRIIREIEREPAYRVDIKDCSLGRGLPVVAILIVNRGTGGFGVNFASHPSFAVALERTLTEAFQGKKLEEFTASNWIGSDAQVHHRDNILNFMKTGSGAFPKEFLANRPDYAFDPDIFKVKRDNAEMLRYMLSLVRQEGGHALIHDSSYLGFPSYHIVVPEMNEMYSIDRIRCREQVTAARVKDSFGHLGALTDEETERMIRYITFKENSVIENEMSWISLRPLGDRLPGGSMAARVMKSMLLYQQGRFEDAAREMGRAVRGLEREQETENSACGSRMETPVTVFYRCCCYYMFLRAGGSDACESGEIIGKLFSSEIANVVQGILADEKMAVKRMYPETRCYDCGHCEMGEKGICSYRQEVAVLKKIKGAMKKNIPVQEELLKAIKEIEM